jgi:hypothetical protein
LNSYLLDKSSDDLEERGDSGSADQKAKNEFTPLFHED